MGFNGSFSFLLARFVGAALAGLSVLAETLGIFWSVELGRQNEGSRGLIDSGRAEGSEGGKRKAYAMSLESENNLGGGSSTHRKDWGTGRGSGGGRLSRCEVRGNCDEDISKL